MFFKVQKEYANEEKKSQVDFKEEKGNYKREELVIDRSHKISEISILIFLLECFFSLSINFL
jgi:hypothetical protein